MYYNEFGRPLDDEQIRAQLEKQNPVESQPEQAPAETEGEDMNVMTSFLNNIDEVLNQEAYSGEPIALVQSRITAQSGLSLQNGMYYNEFGRPLDDNQIVAQMSESAHVDSQPAEKGIATNEEEWFTGTIQNESALEMKQ
jgi:hypothetical protein